MTTEAKRVFVVWVDNGETKDADDFRVELGTTVTADSADNAAGEFLADYDPPGDEVALVVLDVARHQFWLLDLSRRGWSTELRRAVTMTELLKEFAS